jgi:hypothetical protein
VKESDLSRHFQIELAPDGVRLWRFPVGNYDLGKGRWLRVGIPGMSDLLGFTTITITPAMVGRQVAVFTAVEVKTPEGYTDHDRLKSQEMFIQAVQRAGGMAGFAHTLEEARAICSLPNTPGTEG